MFSLIDVALEVATDAHYGQFRKYTFEPYITHPIAVSEIVKSVGGTEDQISAAILHDVVEDTWMSLTDLKLAGFSPKVISMVYELTKKSLYSSEPRSVRKKMDREFLSTVSDEAKTIKLADILHNSESILVHDPEFAKTWMEETKLLLPMLNGGSIKLYKVVESIVNEYFCP